MNYTQDDPGQRVVYLTRGQSIGLAVDAEAGLISVAAVVGVFGLIFIKVWRSKRLVQRPMDLFVLILFFFDIIMALGRVTNIKWVQEDRIYVGSYCTAQGVIQQFGETGSAMVTTVIAIYTFTIVVWGTFRRQLQVAYAVIAFIFLFLIIFIGVTVGTQTHGTQHYMTPDGFWCWIGDGTRYNAERYSGEYMWMWIALSVSVLTYVPLAFVAIGVLRVSTDNWWKFERNGRRDAQVEGQRRRSISMIAYPVVYFILVIPTSIVRWASGFGSSAKTLPSAATLTTECIFSLTGLANVMIFLFTRSDLFMVDNTESRGHSLRRAALPPAGLPGPGDVELAASRSPNHSVLPGVENGGWTLPTAPRASESI